MPIHSRDGEGARQNTQSLLTLHVREISFFGGGGTSLFLLARFFFLRLRAFRVGALERRVAAANPSPSFFLSVCVDVVDVVAAGIAVVAVNVLRLIVEVTM